MLLGLLFGLILLLFIPIPLLLPFMLIIQYHTTIMYSHIPSIGSVIFISPSIMLIFRSHTPTTVLALAPALLTSIPLLFAIIFLF